MTDLLRAAAREYRAIKMGGREHELFDQKLLNGCETEESACMAKIGRNLGVDQILYGRVEASGPAFRIRLTLLDVETTVAVQWSGTVQDAESNMQAAARDAIATLVERFR
jgi:TolB-like protein